MDSDLQLSYNLSYRYSIHPLVFIMAQPDEDPKEMIARMEREMNAPANIQGTAQTSDSGE